MSLWGWSDLPGERLSKERCIPLGFDEPFLLSVLTETMGATHAANVHVAGYEPVLFLPYFCGLVFAFDCGLFSLPQRVYTRA